MLTRYVWDYATNTCLAEMDEQGETLVDYTVDPQTGELISENRGGQEVYHRYDGDGNTRQTADSAGNVLGEATYTAFGETVAESGDMKTTYRFRGQQGFSTDPLTGDVSRASQDYLPALGRLQSVVGFSGAKRNHPRGYTPATAGWHVPRLPLPVDGQMPTLPQLDGAKLICQHYLNKCSELRDIWHRAGKTFTTMLFDKWLNQDLGPHTINDAGLQEWVRNGKSYKKALSAFLKQLLAGDCPIAKRYVGGDDIGFKIEYLPFTGILGAKDPLRDLDDYAYAMGTARFLVAGDVHSGSSRECCCENRFTGTVTLFDNFTFRPGGPRTWPVLGLNPFAEYYNACRFLETRSNGCGYHGIKWSSQWRETGVICRYGPNTIDTRDKYRSILK